MNTASSRVHVDIEPGTSEWKEWRSQVRSASDAPVIMRVAPSYWERRTWEHLRTSEEPSEPSDRTRHMWAEGHRREQVYRDNHHSNARPANLQRGKYGASIDMADLNNVFGAVWWEVKSPTSVRSKLWRIMADQSEQLPEHIYWQLVHQAHVIGDPDGICHLIVTSPTDDSVVRQRSIFADVLLRDWPTLEEQWDQWAAGGQPGLSDFAWLEAATSYQLVAGRYKEAKVAHEKARERLLSLAAEHDQDKVEGGGVSVTTSDKKGTIDWRMMARDELNHFPQDEFDEMAEKYRRPGGRVTTVRIVS